MVPKLTFEPSLLPKFTDLYQGYSCRFGTGEHRFPQKFRLFYLGAQQQDILAQPLTNFFVVEHQESKGRQMQFQVQILPLNLIFNGKKMESDTKRIEIKPIENRAEGGPQGSTGRIGRGPAKFLKK